MKESFKYRHLFEEHGLQDLCPCHTCKPLEIIAYRWVFEPVEAEKNFHPQVLKSPARKNWSGETTCSACGLSMFESYEQAYERFNGFPIRTRNLLGYTHVGKGSLTPIDGVMSEINSYGHFDFFEYAEVELNKKFKIIAEL